MRRGSSLTAVLILVLSTVVVGSGPDVLAREPGQRIPNSVLAPRSVSQTHVRAPVVARAPAPAGALDGTLPAGGLARGYVTHGPRTRKWIALTFDEDMRPSMMRNRRSTRWYDPRIIDLLEKTGTHATVFMNGLFAKGYPGVFRRLADNPNIELGNHSWDHQGWTNRCGPYDPKIKPPMTKRLEVTKTAKIVREKTGIKLIYFRFPAGCYGPGDVNLVRSMGEASIGWDCYFGDALDYSVDRQVRTVKDDCGKGSIVITHLNGPPYHEGVYQALKKLLPWWKNHGWKVVTVGELLGHPTPRP